MWYTDSLWFEIGVVGIIFSLGHIFLGHFEERTPRTRKFIKFLGTLFLVILVSLTLGRWWAMSLLGLTVIPVLYIHFIHLPAHGINGWTGRPRGRYYDFRKWDRNIFED
jgi:hypothetical protein